MDIFAKVSLKLKDYLVVWAVVVRYYEPPLPPSTSNATSSFLNRSELSLYSIQNQPLDLHSSLHSCWSSTDSRRGEGKEFAYELESEIFKKSWWFHWSIVQGLIYALLAADSSCWLPKCWKMCPFQLKLY